MTMLPRGAADKIISHTLAGAMLSGLGIWHLFNHMRLLVSLAPTPSSSSSRVVVLAPAAWFPAPRVRRLEPIAMLAAGAYGLATQMLAYSPMPFRADGSIPPERLPNHEHAIIYASLLVYASSAIYLDLDDALHAPPGGALRAGAVRVPRPLLHRPRPRSSSGRGLPGP